MNVYCRCAALKRYRLAILKPTLIISVLNMYNIDANHAVQC